MLTSVLGIRTVPLLASFYLIERNAKAVRLMNCSIWETYDRRFFILSSHVGRHPNCGRINCLGYGDMPDSCCQRCETSAGLFPGSSSAIHGKPSAGEDAGDKENDAYSRET